MNFDKTTTAETPLIRIVDDEERMRESLAFMLKPKLPGMHLVPEHPRGQGQT